jgi:NADH-quinone oxidoreductase subunit J
VQVIAEFFRWVGDHLGLLAVAAAGWALLAWQLPSPRSRPAPGGRWLPVGLLLVVLLALAVVLLAPSPATVPVTFDVLFYIFAGLAVAAGACMVTRRNPVHAALWFAIVILSTCGLFLLQSAPFLAAATVIVYAGAIIVTFLFVIMLAQQTGLAGYDRRSREPLLACVAGFVLLTALAYTFQLTYAPSDALGDAADRLARAQAVLDGPEGGRDQQLDQLFSVGNKPLGVVVLEEIDRLPGWRDKDRAANAVHDALTTWGAARGARDEAKMKAALADLRATVEQVREAGLATRGVLTPPASVAKASSDLSRPGAGPTAGYVAGLGRSLFGDYLWGVELAGTLLLMATIGAIAIAGRRREGAREVRS